MALVVEDGSGVSGANTYAAVATVDAYHAARKAPLGVCAAWTTATTAQKEAAILTAMAFVEGLSWNGVKASSENALEWPRTYVVDRNGFDVASDAIPAAVVNAVCEAAIRELESPGTLLPDKSRDEGIKSVAVPGVVEVEWSDDAPTVTSLRAITTLLIGLVRAACNFEIGRG
jgi:hypothetical protein